MKGCGSLLAGLLLLLACENASAGRMWAVSREYFTDLRKFSIHSEIYYRFSNPVEPGQTIYVTYQLPPGHLFDDILSSGQVIVEPSANSSTATGNSVVEKITAGSGKRSVVYRVRTGALSTDAILPDDRISFNHGAGTMIRGTGKLPNVIMKAIVSRNAAGTDIIEAGSAIFACLNGVLPDAYVAIKGSGKKGEGVQNGTGKKQRIDKTVPRGKAVEVNIGVANEGGREGTIQLKISPVLKNRKLDSSATLKRKGRQRKNVTAALKTGKLSQKLAPGKGLMILIRVKLAETNRPSQKSTYTRQINFTSRTGKDSAIKAKDTVKAKLKFRK